MVSFCLSFPQMYTLWWSSICSFFLRRLLRRVSWRTIREFDLEEQFCCYSLLLSYCFFYHRPRPQEPTQPVPAAEILLLPLQTPSPWWWVSAHMWWLQLFVWDLILQRLRWPCVTFWTSRCQKSPYRSCSCFVSFICHPSGAQSLRIFLQVGHSGLQSNQGCTFSTS